MSAIAKMTAKLARHRRDPLDGTRFYVFREPATLGSTAYPCAPVHAELCCVRAAFVLVCLAMPSNKAPSHRTRDPRLPANLSIHRVHPARSWSRGAWTSGRVRPFHCHRGRRHNASRLAIAHCAASGLAARGSTRVAVQSRRARRSAPLSKLPSSSRARCGTV